MEGVTSMKITIHIDNLQNIAGLMDLEEEDLYIHYSGRAMYGDVCVGITADRGGEIAFLLAAIELAAGGGFEDDDFMNMVQELTHGQVESGLWDWARETRSDNMGYQTIYYWPSLQISGLEQKDDDE
jgi:hypothetical protein